MIITVDIFGKFFEKVFMFTKESHAEELDVFLFAFSYLISCDADKKHMPKEAIDAKVKRRSLQDAINEVSPLLQKYQQIEKR